MNQKNNYTSVQFFDLPIFSSRMSELLALLLPENFIKTRQINQLVTVFTPNPEQIVLAEANQAFKQSLQQADVLVPDGIGLIIAQKMLNRFGKSTGEFQQRITGVELSLALLEKAEKNGWKTLIIGGRGYSDTGHSKYRVQNVSDNISVKNTEEKANIREQGMDNRQQTDASELSLQTVYWHEGYSKVAAPTKEEEKELQKVFTTLQPEIVFVAFGAPYQEAWVLDHKKLLSENNVRVALVVGGAFDVILGKLQRAPAFVRAIGFEWLFRLFQEPHRWRRQLKLISFIRLTLLKLISKS